MMPRILALDGLTFSSLDGQIGTVRDDGDDPQAQETPEAEQPADLD